MGNPPAATIPKVYLHRKIKATFYLSPLWEEMWFLSPFFVLAFLFPAWFHPVLSDHFIERRISAFDLTSCCCNIPIFKWPVTICHFWEVGVYVLKLKHTRLGPIFFEKLARFPMWPWLLGKAILSCSSSPALISGKVQGGNSSSTASIPDSRQGLQ